MRLSLAIVIPTLHTSVPMITHTVTVQALKLVPRRHTGCQSVAAVTRDVMLSLTEERCVFEWLKTSRRRQIGDVSALTAQQPHRTERLTGGHVAVADEFLLTIHYSLSLSPSLPICVSHTDHSTSYCNTLHQPVNFSITHMIHYTNNSRLEFEHRNKEVGLVG